VEGAELKEDSKSVIAVWDLHLHMEPDIYTALHRIPDISIPHNGKV
jgi:hypothetical protein